MDNPDSTVLITDNENLSLAKSISVLAETHHHVCAAPARGIIPSQEGGHWFGSDCPLLKVWYGLLPNKTQ